MLQLLFIRFYGKDIRLLINDKNESVICKSYILGFKLIVGEEGVQANE